jgi:hypothetical protein
MESSHSIDFENISGYFSYAHLWKLFYITTYPVMQGSIFIRPPATASQALSRHRRPSIPFRTMCWDILLFYAPSHRTDHGSDWKISVYPNPSHSVCTLTLIPPEISIDQGVPDTSVFSSIFTFRLTTITHFYPFPSLYSF